MFKYINSNPFTIVLELGGSKTLVLPAFGNVKCKLDVPDSKLKKGVKKIKIEVK